MRILLVSTCGNTPNRYFPLSLGYLASNLPQEHSIRIVDGTLDNIPAESPQFLEILRDFKPEVVGMTVYAVNYAEAMKVSRVVKAACPGVMVVVGGPHPTTDPEMLMRNGDIDYVFRGEAEASFADFIKRLTRGETPLGVAGLSYRQGNEVKSNPIVLTTDLDRISFPDYRALRLKEYIARGYFYGGSYGPSAPIWLTRGCPYRCRYCSATLINGSKVRTHSIEYIKRLIDHLHGNFGIRQFSIIDDNFTFHIENAKAFCREFIELQRQQHFSGRIRFTTPNGVRMERLDDELLSLMKQAGWYELGIAPESGSRRTLARMGKNLDPDLVPGIVERIKRAGLHARGYFIVGYPGETKEDIGETLALIRKCRFDGILINQFFPIPGTPVFNDLVEAGEIDAFYIPSDFNIPRPLKTKRRSAVYVPPALAKNLNMFWLVLKEHVLLAMRNPFSIVFFIKYNGGLLNIIRRMCFSWGFR